MVELTQRHLSTDLLAHRHKRNAKDRECLEGVVLGRLFWCCVLVVLLLFRRLVNVLVAVVEKLLDL